MLSAGNPQSYRRTSAPTATMLKTVASFSWLIIQKISRMPVSLLSETGPPPLPWLSALTPLSWRNGPGMRSRRVSGRRRRTPSRSREVRGQRSEVRCQRSDVRLQNERRGIIDHASKHCSDLMTLGREGCMIRFRQIFAIASEIEPAIGFTVFAVAIRQFADKMGLIFPFSPRLSQIRTNGSRRTADLIGQRKLFLCRKSLAHLENLHRECVRFLIND